MDEKEIIDCIEKWKLKNRLKDQYKRDDDDDEIEYHKLIQVLKYLVDHEELGTLIDMCNELVDEEDIFNYTIDLRKFDTLKIMYKYIDYETTIFNIVYAMDTKDSDIINLVLDNFNSKFPFSEIDDEIIIDINDQIFDRILYQYGPDQKLLKSMITNHARLDKYWKIYKKDIIKTFIKNQFYIKELYDEFSGDFIFDCAAKSGADKITLIYISYYNSGYIEYLVDLNCIETIKAIGKFDNVYELFLRSIPINTDLALYFYKIGNLVPTAMALGHAIVKNNLSIVELLVTDKSIVSQKHLLIALNYENAPYSLEIIKVLANTGMVDIYDQQVMINAAISRQMPILTWLADQGCDLSIAYHNRTATYRDTIIAVQIKQEMVNQKNKRLQASCTVLDEILDPDIIKYVLSDYL